MQLTFELNGFGSVVVSQPVIQELESSGRARVELDHIQGIFSLGPGHGTVIVKSVPEQSIAASGCNRNCGEVIFDLSPYMESINTQECTTIAICGSALESSRKDDQDTCLTRTY